MLFLQSLGTLEKKSMPILKILYFLFLQPSFFQFIIFNVWLYNWGMECFFQLIHALPLNPRLWPDHDLSKCFMLKVFARTNVENLRNEL